MTNRFTLPTSVLNAFFFILFLILLGVALSGIIPLPSIPVARVGTYQVAAFDTGLALYQNTQGIFYPLTPFNDYYIDTNKDRSTFITREELEKKYYYMVPPSFAESLLDTSLCYLDLCTPSILFDTISHQQSLHYKIRKVSDHRSFVVRSINKPFNPSVAHVGTTIPYTEHDLVFDASGILYQGDTPAATEFAIAQHFTFYRAQAQKRQQLSERTIFVVNPSLPGIMSFSTSDTQSLWLNTDARLIEIEEEVKSHNATEITTEISVAVYDSMRSAIKEEQEFVQSYEKPSWGEVMKRFLFFPWYRSGENN